MKKIVALSTLRQLGIMVMGVGLGSPLLAFFHLVAHAFFKALLFVGVGKLHPRGGQLSGLAGNGHLPEQVALLKRNSNFGQGEALRVTLLFGLFL